MRTDAQVARVTGSMAAGGWVFLTNMTFDLVETSRFEKLPRRKGSPRLLPDPSPRVRHYSIVSVDDHVIEPPHTFEGRFPKRLQDRAPKVVENDRGQQAWQWDGRFIPNIGFNAVAGVVVEDQSIDPTRFDEMRKGAWDIDARIQDMDINGVFASLNFPGGPLTGFGGQRLAAVQDPELGFAAVQAWNDWHIEEWAAPYPERIIPCQIPWLPDVELGAMEIRRNAERGFKAVTFPDNPAALGRPSVHSDHWDPIFRACAETETVICLHVGSSSHVLRTTDDAPHAVETALFQVQSMVTAIDWLYSKVALRYPDIRIALSEGGIGWVPAVLDRIEHNVTHHAYERDSWPSTGPSAADVLTRNFWFCAIWDPSGFAMRERIGVDRILVESDYPHADSTWPNTQEIFHRQLRDLPVEDVRRMTYGNACELFRHPRPDPSWSLVG